MVEKTGEIVAHFKCTIAIQPKSTVILTGPPAIKTEQFKTEKSVQNEDAKATLLKELWKKEAKKK